MKSKQLETLFFSLHPPFWFDFKRRGVDYPSSTGFILKKKWEINILRFCESDSRVQSFRRVISIRITVFLF